MCLDAKRRLLLICLSVSVCLSVAHGQDVAPARPVDGRYTKAWLVLGPFFPDALDTDFLAGVGGEAASHPKAGETVITAEGDALTWTRYQTQSRFVDLGNAVGNHEHATVYLFCYLESARTQKVQILLGSDDGVAMWINGRRVHYNAAGRPLALDEDVFEVDLEAGRNRCLVKVSQGAGEWGFAMRAFGQNQSIVSPTPKIVLWGEGFKTANEKIELSRHWKFHPGDNPEWAAPDFDDRSWETVESTFLQPRKDSRHDWKGIGWFRLHLAVNSSLRNTSLAMSVFQLGASEVYLDGERIYQFGQVGRKKSAEAAYWERNPKVISFGDTPDHVIAVRFSGFVVDSLRQYGDIPVGFLMSLSPLNRSIVERVNGVRTGTIFQMVWTVVPVFVALQHLLLFLFYPRSKEHLYFAISASCFAALIFFSFEILFFMTDAQQILHLSPLRLFTGTLILMLLSALLFLYYLFYPRLPKQFWVFLVGGIVSGIFSYGIYSGVFALVALLEMLRVMLVAIVKRKDGAWLFGIGSLATLVLPIAMILLTAYTGVDERFNVGTFGWLTIILGPLISMSVYLARAFARTNKDLQAQLAQVKQLSAQTLEQEQRANAERMRRKVLELENARKTQELEEARQLQLSMLPKTPPRLPYLDVAFRMRTATEVGGDYYDYNLAVDQTLTFAVGDVTGHGLNAGIVVATAKGLFKTLATNPDHTQTLEKMSQAIQAMRLRRLHMAMTLVTFKGNQITIAAAGMPPALIYRAASQSVEEVLLEGIPLGSSMTSPYQQRQLDLQSGDTILLMSDGLPEMLNPEDQMLDYPQTQALFQATAHRTPAQIIAHLFENADAWANGRPQADDVTLVAMKVKDSADFGRQNSLDPQKRLTRCLEKERHQ